MPRRVTIVSVIGSKYTMPNEPSASSIVRAASGPYADELSASRPKTGIPAAGPTCS